MDRFSGRSAVAREKLGEESGASMVEFAIVLPLLLLLVYGIIEFSLLLYDKAVITNASREGARAAILFVNEDLTPKPNIPTVVNNYAQKYLISFGSDVLDVPAPVQKYENNQWVTIVTVNYQYTFLVFQKVASLIPGGAFNAASINLTAVTTMANEFQPPPPAP